jgi:hypothetical protein
MKKIRICILLMALASILLTSCRDDDYPDGKPEYEHFYYAGYLKMDDTWTFIDLEWNNNSKVTIQKGETGIIKLPVHFYSERVRDYDAHVKYFIKSLGITEGIAKEGVDFEVVDENGNKVQPLEAGIYEIVFPQAKKATKAIYIKPLGNVVEETRTIYIDLCLGNENGVPVSTSPETGMSSQDSRINNKTDQYTVATFTQAYRYPLEFK